MQHHITSRPFFSYEKIHRGTEKIGSRRPEHLPPMSRFQQHLQPRVLLQFTPWSGGIRYTTCALIPNASHGDKKNIDVTLMSDPHFGHELPKQQKT